MDKKQTDLEKKVRRNFQLRIALLALAVVALIGALVFYFYTPPLNNTRLVKEIDALVAEQKHGRDLLSSGHYDEAIVIFNKILEINPDNDDALMDRAVAKYGKKEFAAALIDYQVVLKIDEKSSSPSAVSNYNRALYGQALCEVGMERSESAVKTLHELQKRDPKFVQSYQLLGNIYLDGKNTEEAVDAYTSGLRLNPDSSVLHYDRGVAYLRRSMKEQAYEDISQAKQLDPASIKLLIERANLAQTLGKLSVADSDAKEILKVEPGNVSARNWLKKRGIKVDEEKKSSAVKNKS